MLNPASNKKAMIRFMTITDLKLRIEKRFVVIILALSEFNKRERLNIIINIVSY